MIGLEDIQEVKRYPSLEKGDKDFLISIEKFFAQEGFLTKRQVARLKKIKASPRKSRYINKTVVRPQKCKIDIPERILEQVAEELKDEQEYNLYLYGSRVYGTNKEDSDYDFLAVLKEDKKREQLLSEEFDITFKSQRAFEEEFLVGNINLLEALLCEVKKGFDLKLTFSLKPDFVKKVMNNATGSFIRGKRILKKQAKGDELKGQKSLFHSVRILHLLDMVILGDGFDLKSFKSLYEKIVDTKISRTRVDKMLAQKRFEVWNSYHKKKRRNNRS